MRNRNFLGLSERNSTVLCTGVSLFVGLMGVRVALSPSVALHVADTRLLVGSSTDKLEVLAKQLKEQAQIIEQKDRAYKDLQATYEEYLENKKGSIDLGKKIEALDDLPEVGSIDEIEADISEVEEELLEVSE